MEIKQPYMHGIPCRAAAFSDFAAESGDRIFTTQMHLQQGAKKGFTCETL